MSIDTIGLISGILGIISFVQSNIAEHPVKGATVRIKAGLESGTEDASLAGVVVGVYGWNTNNAYLGSVEGGHIAHGDFSDFTIDQNPGGNRAEYVGISGGDDAICIAWITVSQPDDTQGSALTGDVGTACGQYWYANVETAGNFDNDTTRPYKPNCVWLDSDHTNDIPSAAVKFRVAAFGDDVTKTLANSDVCNAAIWGPDSGPIDAAPTKRAMKARLPWMETQLIVSNFTGHLAEDLCSSPTSWGPDFIGSDGMYCDMGSKILSPLCSTSDVSGCIELDLESNQLAKRTTIARREAEVVHKKFEKIKFWS